MVPNPYQPPPAVAVRTLPFILAGGGALLASGYWLLLTFVLGFGAAFGSGSPVTLLLPMVLVGLYAYRGVQILRGDVAATRRIILLHVFGMIAAGMQIVRYDAVGLIVALQGLKVLINAFGAAMAWWAWKSAGGYER